MSYRQSCLPALLAMLSATAVVAAGSTSWSFDLETGGEDVSWTSSNTVATDASDYEYVYDITYIAADVVFGGLVFGPFDVTEDIDPESRHGDGTNPGPPPVVMADNAIAADADNDGSIDVEAHIYMEITETGHGYAATTDIMLGDIYVDLGWPLGVQNVQIDRVYLQSTIVVTPIFNACPSDVTGDGAVNVDDVLQVIGDWGGAGNSDINGDGTVDVNDMLELLSAWGPCA
jgi:hypothetical protein